MQAAYFAWIADGVERHPDLHVIFAVLAGGAPIQLERLRSRGFAPEAASHTKLYLDTASFGASALRLCLETLGPQQLIFGSDVPVIDSEPPCGPWPRWARLHSPPPGPTTSAGSSHDHDADTARSGATLAGRRSPALPQAGGHP